MKIPLKVVENLITFSVTENTFFTLQLDIPPSPLFLDEKKSGIIPQVSIIDLLSKFNGTTAQVQALFCIFQLGFGEHRKRVQDYFASGISNFAC